MDKHELENLECDLLLDALLNRYGYDFHNYAKASVKRRIVQFLDNSDQSKISEIIPKILYDERYAKSLIQNFSVSVTEMFRDPQIYKTLREQVIPILKTYPFIKIWHAGCSTGEEVYSLAILLKEEGLYDKCQIYATDFNEQALVKAREGIYKLDGIQKNTNNYNNGGGKNSFSEYYHASYESAIMDRTLKKNLTFANHNLVTDSTFGEMHLILCRNVLIYFDKILQSRVLNLFNESLVRNGFLCLGIKESIQFSSVADNYKEITNKHRIYQKKVINDCKEIKLIL